MLAQIDTQALASEWLRALRGKRTQVAFSRRLGYRSNISYRWESQRCLPSASRSFEIIASLGGDVRASLAAFYRTPPAWLSDADLSSVSGVAQLLDDLRGRATITDLARRTSYSRFAVTRWLKGRADPSLAEFLSLIEHTSHRLLDFVASFTDPESLPSVRDQWRLLRLAREAAYDQPWSHAVLRALELEDYSRLERHQPGWLGERLGIAENLERECLAILEHTRQISLIDGRYVPTNTLAVDTRQDARRALQLRAGWAAVGVERLRAGAQGLLAYNLAAVSRADLARIEELQRAYYRQLVGIVAESSPAECVLLYAAQLLELRGAQGPEQAKRPAAQSSMSASSATTKLKSRLNRGRARKE